MLAALSIRDLVLAGRADISFAPGLAVLTGETGAGKSILLDALSLALGARSDPALAAPGVPQASVSAVFRLRAGHPARAFLSEQGLEAGEELIVRRVQGRDGRTRAFLNDAPVGLRLLQDLAGQLVEIHGQHDTQDLRASRSHRAMLDSHGGLTTTAAAVAAAAKDLAAARAALDDCTARLAAWAGEEAETRRRLEELDALDPQPGLEAQLAEERSLLLNGAQMTEGLGQAVASLDSETGTPASLHQLVRQLEKLADQAPTHLAEALEALNRAGIEMEEARASATRLLEAVQSDPQRLETVEARLFGLRAAAREAGVGVDALGEVRARLLKARSTGSGLKDEQRACRKAQAQAQDLYLRQARALSQGRRRAAKKLESAVNRELEPLRMGQARFHAAFEEVAEETAPPGGLEEVRFLAATNPGSPPGPIGRIASGGELSRFMLALKLALAERGGGQSLIFDEIDAGLSGAAAEAVGVRLKKLARRAQVLIVTHAPQIAAHADHHFRVVKHVSQGRTRTEVEALTSAASREEVARMLAGVEVTHEARAAASRLIQGRGR